MFPDIEVDYNNRSDVELISEGSGTAYNVEVQFSSEHRILSDIKIEKPLKRGTSIIVDVHDPFKGEFQGSIRVKYKDSSEKKYCRCKLYVKDPEHKGYFHLNSYNRSCSWIRQILCGGKPPVGKNK